MRSQMKILILLNCFLVAQIMTQTWDHGGFESFKGGQLQHLYSGVKQLGTLPDFLTNIEFNQTFVEPISENVFSSTQSIYLATNLLDFKLDISINMKTLYIENLALDAGRTQLQFDLLTFEDSVIPTKTQYLKLSIGFIIIGSDFTGYSLTLQSSYLYAKNSDVVEVDPSSQTQQISFSTPSSSPFNYLPGADLGQGCGVIRKNGNLIIELGKCEYSKFITFVTGFRYTSDANDEIEVSAFIKSDGNDGSAVESVHNPSNIFKTSSADSTVGLFVRVGDGLNGVLSKIQVSFLFVGVRSYGSYPTQSAFHLDDFLFYEESASSNGPAIIDLTNPPFPTVSPLSHAFCGLTSIKLPANFQSITVQVTASTQLQAAITLPVNNPAVSYTVSCVLFKKRDPCEQQLKRIDLAESTDRIVTDSSSFTVESLANIPGGGSSGVSAHLQPSLKFSYNQPGGSSEKVQIRAKFNIKDQAVIEGEIYISEPPISGDTYTLNLFGSQAMVLVVDSTATLPDIQFVADTITLTNQITFAYEGQRTSNLANQWIQLTVMEHQTVMDGAACTSSCSVITNHAAGINLFTSPPSCQYCSMELFQIFNSFSTACTCMPHYRQTFSPSGQLTCQPCNEQLCYACPTFAGTCKQCVQNAEQAAGICSCLSGYYQMGGQCLACPRGCTQCLSSTSCLSCALSEKTRLEATEGCACMVGTYDNGIDSICISCSPECLTCQGNRKNCTSCNQNSHFQQVGSTCICKEGYYALVHDDLTVVCEKCHSTCASCALSPIRCNHCDESAFRSLTGQFTCLCKHGYVDIQGTCIDQSCTSIHQHCQSCTYDIGTGQKFCVGCGNNRILERQQCRCKDGMFEEGGVCVRCGTACQLCQSQTVCFTCALKALNNGDGSCSCPQSTYLVEAVDRFYCGSCDRNCLVCSKTSSNCSECTTGFILQNNACTCGDGKYAAADLSGCLLCQPNCTSCTSFYSCSQCAEHFKWDGSTCSIFCPIGMYDGGSACLPCPSSCTSCNSQYLCDGCMNGLVLYAGSCRQKCPDGTYNHDGYCYACVAPCQYCTSETECSTCRSGKVLFLGQCVGDCPLQTYFAGSSCMPCHSTCLECEGTSTHCIKCEEDNYLHDGSCYAQCPTVLINNTCISQCPKGEYLAEDKCLPCAERCEECRDENSCVVCSKGYKTYNSDCVSECPAETYELGVACVACDSSCVGCTGSSVICEQCARGHVRNGLRCIEECPTGMYLDPSSRGCQFCEEGCLECVSSTYCIQCAASDHQPLNGVCKKQCPPGAIPSTNGCSCVFGVLSFGLCISSCLQGYYASNGQCLPCSPPCLQCSQTSIKCIACLSGYKMEGGVCVRMETCGYGAMKSSDGECVRRCGNNKLMYKGVCIHACPAGYGNNGVGGCVESVRSSLCEEGEYQLGSSCVKTCQSGYFPNTFTKQCQKCPANCASCAGTSCIECYSNFTLIDGLCTPLTTCPSDEKVYKSTCMHRCPIGTRQQNTLCVQICPRNSYYYNTFCYSTCPEGLLYSDVACLRDCGKYFRQVGNRCVL